MAGSPAKAERRARCAAFLADEYRVEGMLEGYGSGGLSLPDFCKTLDIPYSTVYDYLTEHPEMKRRLQSARDRRVDWHIVKIEQLATDVEEGRLHPKAAEVAVGTRQWLASRMNPRDWGERQQIDVTHTHTHKLHLDAIRALSSRREARQAIARQERATDAAFTVLDAAPALPAPLPPSMGDTRAAAAQDLAV